MSSPPRLPSGIRHNPSIADDVPSLTSPSQPNLPNQPTDTSPQLVGMGCVPNVSGWFSQLFSRLSVPAAQMPIQTAVAMLPREQELVNAITFNQMDVAIQCLKDGANPHAVLKSARLNEQDILPEMQNLLERARDIKRLYPPHSQAGKHPELHRALGAEFDLNAAQSYLEKQQGVQSVAEFWQAAVKNHDEDFMKAILVLLPNEIKELAKPDLLNPNQSVIDILREDLEKIKESFSDELVEFLRGIPYFSSKRPIFKDTNCVGGYTCAELSLIWPKQRASDKKDDYSVIADVQKRSKRYDRKQLRTELLEARKNASELYPVDHDQVGCFIADRLSELKPGQSRWGLFESVHHEMVMEVKAKIGEAPQNEISYVFNFYDPNLTNVHAHATYKNPEFAETLTLSSIIPSKTYQDLYYDPGDNQSLVFMLPDSPKPPSSEAIKGFTNLTYTTKAYSGSLLYQEMKNGLSESLTGLPEYIGNMEPAEGLKNLMFRGPDNSTPLYMAFQNRHHKAIEIFRDTIAKSALSGEQVEEIFKPLTKTGRPVAFWPFIRGDHELIDSLGSILADPRLTSAQVKNILLITDKTKTPGPFRLFDENHPKSIEALSKILTDPKMDEQDIVEIILGKQKGSSGPYKAFEKNNAGSIRALDGLLSDPKLSGSSVIKILTEKRGSGAANGPYMAFEKGRTESITALGALLLNPKVSAKLSPEQIAKTLLGEAKTGCPGPLIAAAQGHTKVLQSLKNILQDSRLPDGVRAHVVKAICDASDEDGNLLGQILPDASSEAKQVLLDLVPVEMADYRAKIAKYL